MKVDIYATTNCQQCKQTIKMFNNKVIFDVINVNKSNSNLLDKFKKTGFKSFPVVYITNKNTLLDSWCGFRPDKIKEYMRS